MGDTDVMIWVSMVLSLAIVGGIFYMVYRIIRGLFTKNVGGAKLYCKSCGHVGQPHQHTKGSMLMEIFLWILLIVPGLIYSIWRVSTRTKKCANCGGLELIPENSPLARKA